MARFTFSAGNARVLARAPLYALGALAAVLVPRSPRRWVFASGIGLGEGALALLALTAEREPERHLTWLASDRAELAAARARGLRALPKRGPRGLWATLRAGVVVVTHGFGDVNRFGVSGARVVQLWHGIPLKRLHLDTGAALRLPLIGSLPGVGRLMAALYRRAGAQIALFPVSSELVAARIRSAFGLPASRVIVTGDPRDDVLLAGTPEARRSTARALVSAALVTAGGAPLPDASPVVLYAPTWRDGAVDAAIPTPAEWSQIAAWADRTGATLLIRSHPLGAGSYAEGAAGSPRIRLLGRDALTDVTPALPALDALVTDYSSIAFDAAIAGVPSVFFAPDLASYLATRGLYQPYREFSGGEPATTWVETLERLEAVLGGGPARDDALRHAAWLRDEVVDHLDGRATERVLEAILGLLGDPVATAPAVPAPPASRRRLVITDAELDDHAVSLRGTTPGVIARLALVGPRQTIELAVSQVRDEFTAGAPLFDERWGAEGLPPRSDDYRLEVTLEGDVHASARAAVATELDPGFRSPLLRAELRADAGTLVLRVAAPLADDERGASAQKRLEAQYRRRTAIPENAVFFESFYSQTAACNPLAIDRELARVRPDVTRYWSVVDRSIAVPEGAVAIVEGSAEWWRVRADARLLVVNDWLRKRWMPRPHQSVLQTWHGTMLKRLALDREGVGLRTRIAVRRESRRWTVLMAQNDYAATILRRAYAFRGPLWVEGYPRNDVLVWADPAMRRAVRARLGLRPEQRAVLYAPTWRDDAREIVDYLDLPSLPSALAALPGEHVVLVRGHSRTLRHGRDLAVDGLIDVTTYPDMAELLLAADVVVTDYSSLMFDITATDTPLVLFAPDREHYERELRGFYFDLLAEAPVPVTDSRAGLIAELARRAAAPGPAAESPALSAWRQRFTALDDGRAAERVVARIIAERMLERG
ncbi:CDP-glycerol glycerophosphotransferase family protein [Microcella humidisoli]|uniref:CDP-glycerol glycerophosphotransferase family protein n=1 Tax=Microcella humidisoli TaxID=2963406 RepID=A0ABY5FV48_9MICO|nr:CDP-glycerol glycerophosphotransferase family protein [Microcella humidisoli]UTT61775.1 CDP-glycerol glycerophosphotransferase family protein [Microcella humidisoli]